MVTERPPQGPGAPRGPVSEYREPAQGFKRRRGGCKCETRPPEAPAPWAQARGAGRRLLRLGGALLLVLCPAPRDATALEVSGDHRLVQRFVEDGAIVQKAWFGAVADYDRFEGGQDLAGTIVLAFRLGRDVEAGVIGGVIDRRREAGDTLFGAPLAGPIDTTGLADATVYGKYRILRSPVELAVGAAVVVPLADESRELGPGSVRSRFFLGMRRSFSRATLVWNLGATDRSASRAPGEVRGRIAALAGTGLVLPLSYVWTFVGEVNYDGARFEGDRGDARLLAGLDWRPTANIVFRGALGRGLSERAPDLSAHLSAAFHF